VARDLIFLKTTMLLTLLLLSSFGAATRVVLFHGRNLRLHDNAALLSALREASGGPVLPVYMEEDAGDHGEALGALGVGVTMGLEKALKQHSGKIQSVHFTPHSDELDGLIVRACESNKVPWVLAADSLLIEDEERKLQQQLDGAKLLSEMSFSTLGQACYKELTTKVPQPDMQSHTSLSLSAQPSTSSDKKGEALALFLLAEYVKLGDEGFTDKYANAYIDATAKSPELRRSLLRLIPAKSLNRGEVMSGLLSPLVAQGCLSPRLLVHARSSLPGWLPQEELKAAERPFSFLFECQLRNEAVRKHWHDSLARASRRRRGAVWGHVEFSRWRGYLYRHAAIQPPASANRSEFAFVLLHGFGGSVDQYAALAQALAARGHSAFAVDSLGFGSAEKAPLSYNQYMWRDHALDFIHMLTKSGGQAEGKRIVIVGNSIGGFAAASSAAVLKSQCSGLVLLNSAGRLLEEDPNPQDSGHEDGPEPADAAFLFPEYVGPKPWALSLFGKAIFALLQPNIQKTTEWLYPTNPGQVRASDLAANILRDSCDPGASEVIAAGGKLPTPRSCDGLFADFGGPVLVAQGAKDPLNDAPARAAVFGRISPRVSVDLLDLGHCPHDEGGELVAASIDNWLVKNLLLKNK